MWHVAYVAAHYAVLAGVIYFFDRADARSYTYLGLFGLLAAAVFENAGAYAGLWTYSGVPKLWLLSVWTWLLYVPYLGFCYFIGKVLVRHGS